MPRPWSDYSLREWLRIKPFEQRYNYARYQAVARWVARRPAVRGDVGALRLAVWGRRVLVTVAFNDAAFIDWQATLVRRNVKDCLHLVVDNSSDAAASGQIERICADHGVGYVKLAPSPWRRPIDGGRAHGSAMNWAWRNVLRPGRPSVFGFIDHDLFPLKPTDPFAPLARHQVAGQVRNKSGKERWFLWAGFCFFRFSAVEQVALDFSLDWAAGLDTGGVNWFALYRQLGSDQVFDAGEVLESIGDDVPTDLARFEWVGDWLHYSNFSTPYDLPAAQREALGQRKRALLRAKLAEALAG
jgi:hypothetical protein